MVKFGTLLAVTTTSSSAIVAPYANITIQPKEYSALGFANTTRQFLEVKYGEFASEVSLYNFRLQDLLNPGHEHHDALLQEAIEDKMEAAYLNDPFYDRADPFNTDMDMRMNLIDVISDWFDNNPTWALGQPTTNLINAINNVVVGAPGQTFDLIENNFINYIDHIVSWGANYSSFNDIEASMQIVTDYSATNVSDFYMDIGTFGNNTSAEIMEGNSIPVIETDVIDFVNNIAVTTGARIQELQFNVADNSTDYFEMYDQQEVRLNTIFDSFSISKSIQSLYTQLSAETTDIYQHFIDGKVNEMIADVDALVPLDTIGDSELGNVSKDMRKFFSQDATDTFVQKYEGIDLEFDTRDLGNQDAEISMRVLDVNGAVIYERVFNTQYESDVYKVQNILETIDWIFDGKDEEHLKDEGIIDDSVALTDDQLDILYFDYIYSVPTSYPSVDVIATWELVPVPESNRYNFVVTFDISKGMIVEQVIREHPISEFDNDFDTSIAEIESVVVGTVLQELDMKMDGVVGNIDVTDTFYQSKYFGDIVTLTSENIQIDSFYIAYDPSAIYPAGFTKVIVSLTNTRNNDKLVNHEIQIGIHSAVEQAKIEMAQATYTNLYKDYLPDWYASGKDLKTFILEDYSDSQTIIWIYANMLDSIQVTAFGNILGEGSTIVGLTTYIQNPDNNESGFIATSTESSIYGLPVDEAEVLLSSYEFNNPELVLEQLATIVDPDNPTVDEMDLMVAEFLLQHNANLAFELDGPAPITTGIGGIIDMDNSPHNFITLTDPDGNFREVRIQYGTDLTSGQDIVEFQDELNDHRTKIAYILDELVLVDNIPAENRDYTLEFIDALLLQYEEDAPTTSEEDWEAFKTLTLTNIYTAFGNGWSGTGSATNDIILEIDADYEGDIPAAIQDRIDTYIAGITIMPIEIILPDDAALDEVVDTITSLTKLTFLIEPIDVDFGAKLMIVSSGITLAIVSAMAGASTIRILMTYRKLKKVESSTVSYSSPKKLIAFSITSAIISAAGAATLLVYIFVTKGGL